jgi:hypothetical protein
MTDIRIVSDPHASEGLRKVVVDHLDSYNIAVTGFREYSPVNLFLRDAGDEVGGGSSRGSGAASSSSASSGSARRCGGEASAAA